MNTTQTQKANWMIRGALCIGLAVVLGGCYPSSLSKEEVQIGYHMSPALDSVGKRNVDIWYDDMMVYDINGRMFVNDWRSLWMTDAPSILSPQPIVNTTAE